MWERRSVLLVSWDFECTTLIQVLKPVLFTALLLLVAGAVVFAAKDS